MPEQRIQELIDQLRESEFVEVKNWLGGLHQNEEKSTLAKEIIALANSGGGHIFIGFDDDNVHGHEPIEPQQDEANAFSQDSISALVHRYCTPAIQCSVEMYRQTGRDIRHPVISVPAAVRVPVFAARQSPDNRTLTNGTVYVRRAGGNSEPCRSQDDWERLLERLVHSRQDQRGNAIRNVLNPRDEFSQVGPLEILSDWQNASRAARLELLDRLGEGHPLRLEQGHYEVAFMIDPFRDPDIALLKRRLDQDRPRYSGWAPFVCLHGGHASPRPMGNVIQAWLVEDNEIDPNPFSSDFWRLSVDGKGYQVRAMEEDATDYGSNLMPRPYRPGFDWVLPVYRVAEVLKLIEWLGLTFSTKEARFHFQVTYHGMNGRRLTNHNLRYMLEQGAEAHQDVISSQISGTIEEIALNIEEMVFSMLRPVFSQFSFTELPRVLVDNVVQDALRFKQ